VKRHRGGKAVPSQVMLADARSAFFHAASHPHYGCCRCGSWREWCTSATPWRPACPCSKRGWMRPAPSGGRWVWELGWARLGWAGLVGIAGGGFPPAIYWTGQGCASNPCCHMRSVHPFPAIVRVCAGP
jgi:hypothetical protein